MFWNSFSNYFLPYRTPVHSHQRKIHYLSLKNWCNKILSYPVHLNNRVFQRALSGFMNWSRNCALVNIWHNVLTCIPSLWTSQGILLLGSEQYLCFKDIKVSMVLNCSIQWFLGLFIWFFVCFSSDLCQAMLFSCRFLRIPAIKISVYTRSTMCVVYEFEIQQSLWMILNFSNGKQNNMDLFMYLKITLLEKSLPFYAFHFYQTKPEVNRRSAPIVWHSCSVGGHTSYNPVSFLFIYCPCIPPYHCLSPPFQPSSLQLRPSNRAFWWT